MICSDIQRLIDYSVRYHLIEKADEIVIRNMLMDTLHVYDWVDEHVAEGDLSIYDLFKPLIDYACEQGVIEDTTANRDLFDTKLMGIVTPLPSAVIREFTARYAESPLAATDWYFDFSQKLNYVRAGRIAKDLKWQYDCDFGKIFSLIQIKSERRSGLIKQNLPGGLSAVVPPDPMPNSEVKRRSADGSVGSPHARVGNCQASN